jgi:predicted outer membrane lipoprotein
LLIIFGVIIGILISLASSLVFIMWREHVSSQARKIESVIKINDEVLIGFLVLAAFALGVFLSYALLSMHL